MIEKAGLTVANIIKTTVFVKDLNDFGTINAAYEAFFKEHNAAFPARSCVEVARLPKSFKSFTKTVVLMILATVRPAFSIIALTFSKD
ncbi:Rid family hydrolase [Proteus mirabilis]|uniref:Rid family hydrolase n=1 Tax=Proteus mirabilis TaxID=584 RepID=UPI0039C616E9